MVPDRYLHVGLEALLNLFRYEVFQGLISLKSEYKSRSVVWNAPLRSKLKVKRDMRLDFHIMYIVHRWGIEYKCYIL